MKEKEIIEVSFLSEFAGEEGSTVYLSQKIPPEEVEKARKKIQDALNEKKRNM